MTKRQTVTGSWISEVAADAKKFVDSSSPREQETLSRITASARFKTGVILEPSGKKRALSV